MPVYDLSSSINSINIAEDVRGSLTPTSVSVTTIAAVILPANSARASASIYNAGPGTAYLREGTSPLATTTLYNYPLPAGKMWEPDPSTRYLGAISAITASGTATIMVSESVIQ